MQAPWLFHEYPVAPCCLCMLSYPAGIAGLLGAAFNSMRMWLWKLRASKTRHVLRIAEVIGMALMVCTCGFFFSWSAGKCIPKNPEWGDDYGMRFQ